MRKKSAKLRSRTVILFLVIFSLVFICSGCWSRIELENMSFISVIGVDRSGDDLQVSFLIVTPEASASSGEDAGGSGSSSYFVLSVKERSIPDAREKISQKSSRYVRFKQLDAIVLGEGLGREGIADVMDYFARHWEMRRSIWVLVAQGSAQEVLLKGAPVQEKVPGTAIRMMMERPNSLAPTHYPARLGNFLWRMTMEGTDAIASAIKVGSRIDNGSDEKVENEGEGEGEATESDGKGDGEAESGKEFVFDGSGVFREDRLVGYLGPHGTRGALRVLGKIQGGIYTVPVPSEGIIGSLVTKSSSAKVKPVIKGDHISFKIEIKDEGYV